MVKAGAKAKAKENRREEVSSEQWAWAVGSRQPSRSPTVREGSVVSTTCVSGRVPYAAHLASAVLNAWETLADGKTFGGDDATPIPGHLRAGESGA
jgi:hypothetical protein